jgi:hypothetical protein
MDQLFINFSENGLIVLKPKAMFSHAFKREKNTKKLWNQSWKSKIDKIELKKPRRNTSLDKLISDVYPT